MCLLILVFISLNSNENLKHVYEKYTNMYR